MVTALKRPRRSWVPGGKGAIRQQTIDEMEIVVDNFAGWGGASSGIAQALGREVDVAINHSPGAIAIHRTNHPATTHYCESVYDVDPLEVTQGRPVGLGWFSPDCTHFSGAKGGKPVEKGIRGLAWVVVKWAALVRPRVQMVENVPEFRTWGPIDDAGYPIKSRAGETFQAFIACLTTGLAPDHPAWEEIRETLGPDFPYEKLEQGLGYQVEWNDLRACDYGAPTIRKRLFIVMRCDGRPIVWPEPTHGDPKSEEVRSGRLKPWRTAADIIDWSIECPSIFDRKKPLAENTLKRIARGIKRFILDNPNPFVIRLNYPSTNQRERMADEPLQTGTAKNDLALVAPYIARIGQTNYGGDRMQYPANQSLTTVTSKAEHLLVSPTLIQVGYGERDGQAPRALDLDKPLGTVPASANKFAVAAIHLDRQFTKSIGQPADAPVGAILAGGSGKTNLVAAFLAQYNSETPSHFTRGQDLNDPLYTVPTANRYGLVTSNLVKLRGTCAHGQPVTEPVATVTASGLHLAEVRAFLVKYFSTAVGQACTEPLHTQTAKARFGLVTIHGEDYQIVDIGMRMLEPRELFRAQDFPDDYIIDVDCDGKKYSKADQVAGCGNAVPPAFSRALVRANLPELCEQVAA